MNHATAIPISAVRDAWWWDCFHVARDRFNRTWAERIPDGHFLPVAIESIPAHSRGIHNKVLARARQRCPTLIPTPSVCGLVNSGGKIEVLIGYPVEVAHEMRELAELVRRR